MIVMPVEFSRSTRSLNRDGFGRSMAALGFAVVVLALWLLWFFRAQVARYEVTDSARLETEQAGYDLQTPVAGKVVTSNLALGRSVGAGEILVEIETDAQRLELRETEARQTALKSQIAARRVELAAQEETTIRERNAAVAAIEQSRAQHSEAEALRQLADREAERQSQLVASGLAAARDQDRALAEARSRKASVESLSLATSRLEREQLKAESERQTLMQQLRVEITRLQGELMSLGKTADRQQYELVRRQIRAPEAGRLGDVTILRPGSFVDEGSRFAVLIPSGGVRVVAEFLPAAALGRIRPGQKAWMRLDGFPWTQYGAVPATVERTADEVRDGRIRVELRVDDPASVRVPLQHGLPGTLEVQVELITPATLALRTAGQLLSQPGNQNR
jgi:membrane fusion protein (multidrug efflux system)